MCIKTLVVSRYFPIYFTSWTLPLKGQMNRYCMHSYCEVSWKVHAIHGDVNGMKLTCKPHCIEALKGILNSVQQDYRLRSLQLRMRTKKRFHCGWHYEQWYCHIYYDFVYCTTVPHNVHFTQEPRFILTCLWHKICIRTAWFESIRILSCVFPLPPAVLRRLKIH